MLRRRFPRPFRLLIAGAGESELVNRLGEEPEVELAGMVPDVAPYYDQAGAVIAPIRAGGGTRIKILEAFSYRKPVVATSLAAEGIEAAHGRELLLADSPAAFADSCAALLGNADLRAALAEKAYDFVTARHSLEALTEILRPEPR